MYLSVLRFANVQDYVCAFNVNSHPNNKHVFSLSLTKEYLISLGNRECSPQTFLENSSCLDKLLIIIMNEDIAAHVHKVHPLITCPPMWPVTSILNSQFNRFGIQYIGVLLQDLLR